MSLQDRLEALRRQSGAAAPDGPSDRPAAGPSGGARAAAAAPPGGGGDEGPARVSLADRLRHLRGASPGPAPPRAARVDAAALAELLEGERLAPGLVLTERRVPLAGGHGAFSLRRAAGAVHGLPEGPVDARRAVYLDTETSGLSGGSGTVVFLLGLGRVEGDALVVRQYVLTAFSGEADLLCAAGQWAAGAERIVTFNGRSFDVPLIAVRCRMAGVADRFSPLPHLDLLPATRRAFGRRWDDCRLATAERRLLRFEREGDLPGSEAPESWLAFIRRGDAERMPLVAEHNHRDVVSLAALLPALADVHAEPGAWEADVLAVARAHRRAGAGARAFALLREHHSMLDAEGLLELARFHRRGAAWEEACAIWEPLAARGHPEAVERLAKYHEHVRRDPAAALILAERLPGAPEHDRRRKRLRQKLCGETGTEVEREGAPLNDG